VVKDILFRAAARVKIPVTLLANRWLSTPPSAWVRLLQVAGGFDVADREIVARMEAGDPVVTADIPLAAQVVEAQPHGQAAFGGRDHRRAGTVQRERP
jgi:uncharacterized protein YaiI (UPF0178 family)